MATEILLGNQNIFFNYKGNLVVVTVFHPSNKYVLRANILPGTVLEMEKITRT